MFKTLRKIGNKLEAVNHHYDLLTGMQENHLAPKGLKVRVNPTVNDLPIDLYTKWEEAHANFTSNLTNILIEHWHRKKDTLTEDHVAAYANLQATTDTDELTYIVSLVSGCRIAKKEELLERRQKKRKEKTDASEEEPNTNQEETPSTSQASNSAATN